MATVEWFIVIAAVIALANLLAILRPRSGQSTSPVGPVLSSNGRPPDFINTVRTVEDEARDLVDVRPPKDPSP